LPNGIGLPLENTGGYDLLARLLSSDSTLVIASFREFVTYFVTYFANLNGAGVLGDIKRDVFGAAMIRAQLAKRTTVK
jgi:hypothetical protein